MTPGSRGAGRHRSVALMIEMIDLMHRVLIALLALIIRGCSRVRWRHGAPADWRADATGGRASSPGPS
jgi:hypothetical protein